MRALIGIAFLIPAGLCAQAGNTVVGADVDTTLLRIGEQVKVTLHVTCSPELARTIQWPTIGDTLTKHIEILHDTGIDTAITQQQLQRHVRTLTVTSFDTGYWAVPPFRFVVNGTPLGTAAMLLHVQGVQLDSALTVRDIKDIHTLPFSLGYWLRKHWLPITAGFAVLAVVAALIYFLLRKRKPARTVAPPAINIPLHERILKALSALEHERVWQHGDHKGYHSRLTDLLRGYIEERYRVPALESTTDELIKELRVSPLTTDQRGQLQNMLELADLVKFAKTLPSPQENEQMMAGACRFVRDTAALPTPVDHA